MMSTSRSLRRQLNLWTLIALAVFVFGVAMLAGIARNGGDGVMWTLIVGVTLASATTAAWLVTMRTRLS